ncbi:Asp/Glu/hydantoin racemase [Globomyces pollinis-pini]|nr:Asp/Glu/hydantoin racemase [Globomyces pollinis-pini]
MFFSTNIPNVKGKKIGVIAGLAPETSCDFYLEVVEYYRKNSDHYPSIILRQVSCFFKDIMLLAENKTGEGVKEEILVALKDLQDIGCELVCIPCNTVHKWLNIYQSHFPNLKFISIIEASIKKVLETNLKSVLILASKCTIMTELYQRQLEQHNINYVLVNETDCEFMTDAIKALNSGVDTHEFEDSFGEVLDRYLGMVDGTLLACTDLYRLCTDKVREGRGLFINSNDCLVEAVCEASLSYD